MAQTREKKFTAENSTPISFRAFREVYQKFSLLCTLENTNVHDALRGHMEAKVSKNAKLLESFPMKTK